MGFQLRPGVTCCRSGGFTFLLDIDRDRYFALADAADRALHRLAGGTESGEAERRLASSLIRDRLLIETDGNERPHFCEHSRSATDSALDLAAARNVRAPAMAALGRLALAKWSLRHRGLAFTLRRLGNRHRAARRSSDLAPILRVAAAFERCDRIASPGDQCLPRSIAVAHCLLDRGVVPTLLIGVQAQPFSAHAWVEAGGLIVNDRFDTIHPYQPILAL